jgi:hypothetical protein
VRGRLLIPAIDEVSGAGGKAIAAIGVSDLQNWAPHSLCFGKQQFEFVLFGFRDR